MWPTWLDRSKSAYFWKGEYHGQRLAAELLSHRRSDVCECTSVQVAAGRARMHREFSKGLTGMTNMRIDQRSDDLAPEAVFGSCRVDSPTSTTAGDIQLDFSLVESFFNKHTLKHTVTHGEPYHTTVYSQVITCFRVYTTALHCACIVYRVRRATRIRCINAVERFQACHAGLSGHNAHCSWYWRDGLFAAIVVLPVEGGCAER